MGSPAPYVLLERLELKVTLAQPTLTVSPFNTHRLGPLGKIKAPVFRKRPKPLRNQLCTSQLEGRRHSVGRSYVPSL